MAPSVLCSLSPVVMVHFHILSLWWSLKDFVKLHLQNYQGKYEKLSYKTPSGTFQAPVSQDQGHSICESELAHWQRGPDTSYVSSSMPVFVLCLWCLLRWPWG